MHRCSLTPLRILLLEVLVAVLIGAHQLRPGAVLKQCLAAATEQGIRAAEAIRREQGER